jgi:peptidoglycan hydrolase CwlO-like protein
MTDKGKTKKELEAEVVTLESDLENIREQLTQVSMGYQNLLNANGQLQSLVQKYEETINILTGRLIEARAQG